MINKDKRNEYMKQYWKTYSKTKRGFIQRLYTKMKSRIKGTHGHNCHLYEGKGILNKEDFYMWINSQPEFHKLFELWTEKGHTRSDVPTVDRVDPDYGYEKGNIEVVTFSENMRRSKRRSKLPSSGQFGD